MVTGHNFSIWRSPIAEGWTLLVRCQCGFEEGAIGSYEEAELCAEEHLDDVQTTAELEAEERAHQ